MTLYKCLQVAGSLPRQQQTELSRFVCKNTGLQVSINQSVNSLNGYVAHIIFMAQLLYFYILKFQF